tara:strand:- start:12348 stop:12749 length:402 start_codon:yes stop_codon:yes gene_type:complete
MRELLSMETIKRNIKVPHLSEPVDVEIYIQSEQKYGHGYNEDGEREIVEVYFLQLQVGKDGARYVNEEADEDLSVIEALFVDIVKQLDAEDGLDWIFWDECDPAYGSERYIKKGTEYSTMAFEERKKDDELYM